MDGVAARANVSKQTIYAHFRSKDELFAAIVHDVCERILKPFREADVADLSPDETLFVLARQFVEIGFSPPILGLHRLVLAEAKRFPELSRIYYDAGVGSAITALAAYFDGETRAGKLAITQPRQAAEQFFAMASGNPHMKLLLSLPSLRSNKDLDRYIRLAVSLFLNGCRGRPARGKR